jgi:exopolysaccharide production protein ExoY
LVRLSSPGPAIFRQARVGFRGNHFTVYKFRTMVSDHPQTALEAQATAATEGILLKGKDDARVTPIGKWLRSTSLDELPQLFNVLRGEMSLVGPRPLMPFMLEKHPEFSQLRSLVRPGITGLWQVSERHNNTSAAAMLPYDVEYVRRFSLLTDVRILLKTPLAVFAGKGAY